MMRVSKFIIYVFCFLFLTTGISYSQETSATLSGHITDNKGVFLNGATVALKHQPTGTITTTQSNNKGIFYLTNLKPGGPYTITITYVGFKDITLNDINLGLGNNPNLDLNLESANKNLMEVVVSGSRRAPSGGLTVGRAQLNTLPTLGRSLSDFTRLTPQSNNNSFAGSNFRYN